MRSVKPCDPFALTALLVALLSISELLAAEPKHADDKYTVPVLSTLLGAELHNAEGASLGELDDVAIAPDGTLRYAIIGAGGLLDIGEHHLAVPWRELKIDWSEQAMALPLTHDRLMASPRLQDKGFKELDDPAWMTTLKDSYQLSGDLDLQEEEVEATLDSKVGFEIKADPEDKNLTYGKLRSVTLASNLIGTEVQSPKGEELGEVEYLIADRHAKRVAFVILGKGGVLDVGETLIPVPWQAIQPKQKKEQVVVVLHRNTNQLQQVPRVSSDFPELLDPEFRARVMRHYDAGGDK